MERQLLFFCNVKYRDLRIDNTKNSLGVAVKNNITPPNTICIAEQSERSLRKIAPEGD